MLDSYADTLADYPDGGYFWRIGKWLGVDDIWQKGQGGADFLATNNGASLTFRGRLADIVSNMPTGVATPTILLTHGSINDAVAADAPTLQAEVLAYYSQAFAAPPNAYLVQMGLLRSSGSTPSDAYYAAVKAGFQAAQAIYDPTGARSGFIETRGTGFDVFTVGGKAGAATGAGNTDFYDYSDGAHPTQDGHDFLGDIIAGELLRLIDGRRNPA